MTKNAEIQRLLVTMPIVRLMTLLDNRIKIMRSYKKVVPKIKRIIVGHSNSKKIFFPNYDIFRCICGNMEWMIGLSVIKCLACKRVYALEKKPVPEEFINEKYERLIV